jgi:hypothetical protein
MQWTFHGRLRAVLCLFRELLGPFLTQTELATDT